MKRNPLLLALVLIWLWISLVPVSAYQRALTKNMSGTDVFQLQQDLKQLKLYPDPPAGFFGEKTGVALASFQKTNGLPATGTADQKTLALLCAKLGKPGAVNAATFGKTNFDTPWFGNVEKTFATGSTVVVYDCGTGLSLHVTRSYGANHADCEAPSLADTKIMRQIWGGESWDVRPVVVIVDGKAIAAGMAGMPHAGNDAEPALAQVDWRSGDYGAGENYDNIKNNGQNGHFDIHFRGSRTHNTNKVSDKFQTQIDAANQWLITNGTSSLPGL